MLAGRLDACGLRVFFDEWIMLGDVVVHRVEEAIRRSTSGIAVISPASIRSPQAMDEYAALYAASAERGMRFIPVLIGDIAVPPFAATRVWRDFRKVGTGEYDAKISELAAAILGQVTAGEPGVPRETFDAVLPTPPQPITEPDRPALVICYVDTDKVYGGQLTGLLRRSGLPVWSIGDLRPGEAYFRTIRGQLAHAIAVIVLMSPQSQDSDDISRMIIEGQRNGRPFMPILLHGECNFQLAHSWYLDARDGQLPGAAELAMLERLYQADVAGDPLDAAAVLPAPLTRHRARTVRVPHAASLDRLDRYLGEGELEHADLLTTALLLESVDRSADGWIGQPHGSGIPPELLAGIDGLWARHCDDRQGFRVQLGLAVAGAGRSLEFLRMSVAYGWCDSAGGTVPRYHQGFAARAGPGARAGFFPTLRNPQNEHYLDWYDQWAKTVLAVHLRLRDWAGG